MASLSPVISNINLSDRVIYDESKQGGPTGRHAILCEPTDCSATHAREARRTHSDPGPLGGGV